MAINVHCRECGEKISETATSCPHCGARQNIGGTHKGEGKEVNWTLTLIMSIIFGWLGVDRFMMGQVGLGLLKLFTCGGFFVWWIIDIVLIATKHEFKDVEWVFN